MVILSAEELLKRHPEQILFEDLTFNIHKGEKIALVANNGTGKSSLLKILAGQDVPDEGRVTVREGIRIGYLPQKPTFSEGETIQDFINAAHHNIRSVIASYHRALEKGETAKLEELSTHLDVLNGWDYDRDLQTLLTKFGINQRDESTSNLSGGQQKRLALAVALADSPDLLLLDEPTNHLDIDMIEWLENHLAKTNISVFMVTHDRYFLDAVCNQILELHKGQLYRHNGNYVHFLEKRAERESILDRTWERDHKMLRRELEWMRRMPQARTTKAKSRINAVTDLATKVADRSRNASLSLAVKMSRVGGKILELKNISKSFDREPLIKGFTYTFKKGDRIGIVGPNGTGKSTLLKLMTGELQPDVGKVNVGETTIFGHYRQSGLEINPDERIIDVVKGIAENLILANGTKVSASQFLTHFMFPPSVQYKPVVKLSGGELRRLHLITVLIKNPNFLILDEPTNDLDLLTLNSLEQFLNEFTGCLILVSHDRYFMDKLVDHLFILQGNGQIKGYNGTYTEYRFDSQSHGNEKARERQDEQRVKKENHNRKKASKREKNEIRKLEREIEALESEKAILEQLLSTEHLSIDQIREKSSEIGDIIDQIEIRTERWMQLADLF